MKKTQSISNYILLLVVAFTALSAMNVYLKRSVQAKVKDMSDAFISPTHIFQINDTGSTTTSETSFIASESIGSGGAKQTSLVQSVSTDRTMEIFDNPDSEISQAIVPASVAAVNQPVYEEQ